MGNIQSGEGGPACCGVRPKNPAKISGESNPFVTVDPFSEENDEPEQKALPGYFTPLPPVPPARASAEVAATAIPAALPAVPPPPTVPVQPASEPFRARDGFQPLDLSSLPPPPPRPNSALAHRGNGTAENGQQSSTSMQPPSPSPLDSPKPPTERKRLITPRQRNGPTRVSSSKSGNSSSSSIVAAIASTARPKILKKPGFGTKDASSPMGAKAHDNLLEDASSGA